MSPSEAGAPCAAQDSTAGGSEAAHMLEPEPMAAGERRAEVEGEGETAAEAAGRGVLHTRHGASGAE